MRRGDIATAQEEYRKAAEMGSEAAKARLTELERAHKTSPPSGTTLTRNELMKQYAALLQRQAEVMYAYSRSSGSSRDRLLAELDVLKGLVMEARSKINSDAAPTTTTVRLRPFEWPDTKRGLETELQRASLMMQGKSGQALQALRDMGGLVREPPTPTGVPVQVLPFVYVRLPPQQETPELRTLATRHERIEREIVALSTEVQRAKTPAETVNARAAVAEKELEKRKMEVEYEEKKTWVIRTRRSKPAEPQDEGANGRR